MSTVSDRTLGSLDDCRARGVQSLAVGHGSGTRRKSPAGTHAQLGLGGTARGRRGGLCERAVLKSSNARIVAHGVVCSHASARRKRGDYGRDPPIVRLGKSMLDRPPAVASSTRSARTLVPAGTGHNHAFSCMRHCRGERQAPVAPLRSMGEPRACSSHGSARVSRYLTKT